MAKVKKKGAAALTKDRGDECDGGWSWYCTPFFSNGILYAQASQGLVALR